MGALVLLALLLLGGCASKPEVMPQDVFWNNLGSLCGKAYPGRVITDTTGSTLFEDRPLTLVVHDCTDTALVMTMIVGAERWADLELSRDEGGLDLAHVHPSDDAMPSGYGGSTRAGGTAVSQDFYADEFTGLLREGAEDTVWTMEMRPGAVLSYGLHRAGSDRRFRAVFDLTRGRPAATALRLP